MVEYFTLFNLEGIALKEVNKSGPPTKPNEVGLAGKRRNKATAKHLVRNEANAFSSNVLRSVQSDRYFTLFNLEGTARKCGNTLRSEDKMGQ